MCLLLAKTKDSSRAAGKFNPTNECWQHEESHQPIFDLYVFIYLFCTCFCTWQWKCMTHTTGFFSFCLCHAALRSREKNKLPEVHVFSQKSIRETAWADSTRERGLTHYHQITPKEMSCGHAQPQSLTTKEDEYEMPTWIFSPRLATVACSGPDLHVGGRGGRQATDYSSRLCFNICKRESTQFFFTWYFSVCKKPLDISHQTDIFDGYSADRKWENRWELHRSGCIDSFNNAEWVVN